MQYELAQAQIVHRQQHSETKLKRRRTPIFFSKSSCDVFWHFQFAPNRQTSAHHIASSNNQDRDSWEPVFITIHGLPSPAFTCYTCIQLRKQNGQIHQPHTRIPKCRSYFRCRFFLKSRPPQSCVLVAKDAADCSSLVLSPPAASVR